MPYVRQPFNRVKSLAINAASTNIPTTFSTGATSLVMTALEDKGYSQIAILNDTSSNISLVCTDQDAATPDSSSTEQIYCTRGSATVINEFSVFSRLFIRSVSGSAITSGNVYIMIM
jgi:hypothetical protein